MPSSDGACKLDQSIALLVTAMRPVMQVVPLLALLDDLAPRMASRKAGHLQKVVLVWLSQSGDEFHIMDPELLSLAR